MTGQKTGTAQLSARSMAITALVTAILCIVSPFSIPIGPVPMTLGVLVVLLAVFILGRRRGTMAVALYLLIGLAGLPVFSGFSGGAGKLFGPTGGYLIGYLPMVWIAGRFIEKSTEYKEKKKTALSIQILGMALGLAVLYLLGTTWFTLLMNRRMVAGSAAERMTFLRAVQVCVLPFVPVDLIKIVLAAMLGNLLRSRLRAADLLI